MNDFIFASSSPRRIEIVKKLDLNISFVHHEYEENNSLSKSPDELVIYNATQKAKSISSKYKDKYIFASDTLVFFQNKAVGKPKNKKDAFKILTKLNDDFHLVVTSIVCLRSHNTLFSKTKTSLVQTNNMSTDKINKYIDTRYFRDKAGGYGIQNKDFDFVKVFFGCYENILGIPTCLIKECIAEINLEKIYNFSSCRRMR
ncbi:MAG: Maf family protein [Chloroflexota bacterium]|nr:Maf family protein [Chloroflexota bacterium]